MEKLKDSHIRAILMEQLNSLYKDALDTRIINELGIDFGKSRVDIAVVNGILHGYEIKSESDTLNRLPNQISHYNLLFERMTIVVDKKHLEEVSNIVPDWWGLTLVKKVKGTVSLVQKRKGRRKTSQDKEILLKLLWKEELEAFIDHIGYPKAMKRMKKLELLKVFNEEVKIEIVRPFVYEALKERQYWRN